MTEVLAQAVLDFWFGPLGADGLAAPERSRKWFSVDPEFDLKIERQFSAYIDPASMGGLDRWSADAAGLTALIILLDQFPRNLFRGHARSYYYDNKSLDLSLRAIDRGVHLELPLAHAHFLVLPTMHSEHIEIQDRCKASLSDLIAHHPMPSAQSYLALVMREADRHRDEILRFGRFPMRNASLGRESTSAELEYILERTAKI